MARAYIVLARNDLEDNLLQVLDLKPNSSQFLPSQDGQNSGQTGYQTFYLLDGINAAVVTQAGAGGGASIDVDGDTYGLSAYLIDHVEDTGANQALTAVMAVAISASIEAAAAAGTALTLVDINAMIVAAGAAGSDLDGTLGNSTGTVEEVLRILAGERYLVPDLSQVQVNAGTFDATVSGYFVTRPNVENPASVDGTYGPVRGRKSTSPLPYIRPGEVRAGQVPVQTGTQDVNFNNVRIVVDTGDLHLSAQSGVLADLKVATFAFLNPVFTYGGGANPAQDLSVTNIPATGVARAVTIYDVSGNVI